MGNSITDHTSNNVPRIISCILLDLSQDRNKVCVVVEGINDYKLFKFVLSENTKIFQSYSSDNVDKIVQYFDKNKRVIGIRDKDYLPKPINERCFFCDYSCAEMMIIAIDSCFSRLHCNYYKGEMDSAKLRIHCLERLEKLSKLRKLNACLNWHIRFDGTKPGKYYQNSIDDMNNAIIADLNNQNSQNPIDAERAKMCEELPKCSKLQDYLLITNGHDFINLFCHVAKTQCKQEEIGTTMRATLGRSEFMSTDLYKDLLDYQNKNNITIVQ